MELESIYDLFLEKGSRCAFIIIHDIIFSGLLVLCQRRSLGDNPRTRLRTRTHKVLRRAVRSRFLSKKVFFCEKEQQKMAI